MPPTLASRRPHSTAMYSTLKVTTPSPGVAHVQLARPGKRNAIDRNMWRELGEAFKSLADDAECRAIMLSGEGKAFCAGIDLASLTPEASHEPARRGFALRRQILDMQDTFTAMERCPQPTLALVHGPCIGAGLDMILAADVRWCSDDATFCVKEVDLGLAADVGTLQRLPSAVGSSSLARELCFSARVMTAIEAEACGLVSRRHPHLAAMAEDGLRFCSALAIRSPMAMAGTKRALVYARDHSIADALDQIATWNAFALQGADMEESMTAHMQGRSPMHARL